MVCDDSYFASVSTEKELMRLDMRFIGFVKTVPKKFTMAYLQALEFDQRGEWKGLGNATTSMYAFVWVDCNRRYFITNTSSLAHGNPYTRVRKGQVEPIESQEPPVRVEFTINQPKSDKMYYNTCGNINHHNRRRHDILRLERKVDANDWYKQVNQSILRMIEVDNFSCYNQLVGESEKEGNLYLKLAEELNVNKYDSIRLRPRHSTAEQTPSIDAIGKDGRLRSGIRIHLTPTKRKRKGSNKALHQGRCNICKVKSSHECSVCVDKMMATITTFYTPKVAATALRNTYIIHMRKMTKINTNDIIFRINYNSIN